MIIIIICIYIERERDYAYNIDTNYDHNSKI